MMILRTNIERQKLSYFPQIKVVHTSKTFHGQLYVPMMNWLLMIGTVMVAAIYNNVSFPSCYSTCSILTDVLDNLSWKRLRV